MVLRWIDVRYLLPKRVAFRAELEREVGESEPGDTERSSSRDVDKLKTRVVNRHVA